MLHAIEFLIQCIRYINSILVLIDSGRSAAIFRLLPLLLPPPAGTKALDSVRRPSQIEVQNEFLLHVQVRGSFIE